MEKRMLEKENAGKRECWKKRMLEKEIKLF